MPLNWTYTLNFKQPPEPLSILHILTQSNQMALYVMLIYLCVQAIFTVSSSDAFPTSQNKCLKHFVRLANIL